MKRLLFILALSVITGSAFGQWIWSTNYNLTKSDSLANTTYILVETADSTEALAVDTIINYFNSLYGNVFKVGTPANNQVGVWTGDGTLEGPANFTFDGTTLGVDAAATFNNSGVDVDFSVKAVGESDALFVQGSDGRLGFGTNTPLARAEFLGLNASDPVASWFTDVTGLAFLDDQEQPSFLAGHASALADDQPLVFMRRSRGTLAIPSTVADGDDVGSLLFSPFDGTAFQNTAEIKALVDGTVSAGSVPTVLTFTTGPNTAGRAERIRIGPGTDISFLTLASDDTEDHVMAIDDATGLLTKRSVASIGAPYEPLLTNSAGLAAALSDETGTGLAVFATSPTFTTSIQLGSTIIDETELSSIDGASGEAFLIDTTGWLLSDTILLGLSSAIDTFNTTWYYDLFDSDRTSDSVFVSHAAYRCTGTTVDFNVSIFADDTINSSLPSDTIIYNFNVTNESGVSVDITTLNDQVIEKGKCAYWKIESITTAPDQFGIRLYGGRQNSTY